MLKTRVKRLAARGEHAVERLTEIETSIASLGDEDILDLADIFRSLPDSTIGDIVRPRWSGGTSAYNRAALASAVGIDRACSGLLRRSPENKGIT